MEEDGPISNELPLHDEMALSLANVVTLANRTAIAHGKSIDGCIVTITEDRPPPSRHWQIHFGPRDYVSRRGGDLTVFVDEQANQVCRILRGQ